MRLEACHDTHGLTVRCLKCGRYGALRLMKADLDGPAFKAYFHPECVPATGTEAKRLYEAS